MSSSNLKAEADVKASLTFEQALAELEEVVASLEEGALDLEDTVVLYQRGRGLAEHCQHLLDDVALRVQQLTSENETVPLDSAPQGALSVK
jgi:exodeoxyribonuclease VII small subunit